MKPFVSRIRGPLVPIAVLGAIILGCGGSGGSSETTGGFRGLTITPTNSKVTLPASRSYGSLSELSVWTSAGEGAPATSGDVQVKVFNNGPQYTEVRDDDDKLVASGFIGTGRTELGFESTAEVLVYFGIGGPLQRGSNGSQKVVLDSVKNLPGFSGVVTAVTDSFNSKGYIDNEDTAIKSAVAAVRDSILTSRERREATSRGPDVDPSRFASGLEINNSVNDQILLTNTAFRRGYLWLKRTGYKDSEGVTHDLDVSLASKEVALPARYGGTIDSATGLINSQYNWEPVTMPKFDVTSDLPGIENEVDVFYELTTVGIGWLPGDFDELTGAQITKWEEIVYQTVYLDFYLPVFANLVIPLDGAGMDSVSGYAGQSSAARAFFTNARTSMPNVASEVAKGNFTTGLSQFVTSSQLPTVEKMTADIMISWGRQFGTNLFKDEEELHNRVGRARVAINMLDLVDATDDMAPIGDLRSADQANIFRITSSRSAVKITPDEAEVGISETTDIRATIKDKQAGATYRYEWSLNTTNFFLQDAGGNSTDESPGGVLKTSYDKVFIGNLTFAVGTPTITCRVYIGDTFIGTANTRVEFKESVNTTPGRYKIVGGVFDKDNNGTFNLHYGLVAEVDVKKDADHYSMVAEYETGETIKRVNWAATSPPYWPLYSELKAGQPPNTYWIVIDGTTTAGGNLTEAQAREQLASEIARLEVKYNGMKVKTKVFYD
ncbi:MAG: hypothetical protein KF812_01435 [Fimbriimonadaceae bacterium]|nr:hypothetical protein [Fimbriimonadaceae bacterium]